MCASPFGRVRLCAWGRRNGRTARGCTVRSPWHSFIRSLCVRDVGYSAYSHYLAPCVLTSRHAARRCEPPRQLSRSFVCFVWFVRVLHRSFVCLLACLLACLLFLRYGLIVSAFARVCALDSVLESAHFLAAAGRVGEAAAVLDKARLPLDATRRKRESAQVGIGPSGNRPKWESAQAGIGPSGNRPKWESAVSGNLPYG
jgi:hypothetical protein